MPLLVRQMITIPLSLVIKGIDESISTREVAANAAFVASIGISGVSIGGIVAFFIASLASVAIAVALCIVIGVFKVLACF